MFRFTIRDVLWLTTLVALAAGWAIDRANLSRVNAEFVRQRDAEARFAKLRALELDRKAIIAPDPF